MSSIAIGDLHGNLSALNDLLSQLEPTLTADDTMIFLGDYIDRGPDSRQCIDRVIQCREASMAKVVTLRGNHEDWLLETMDDYTSHSWLLAADAYPTIESYSPDAADALRVAARAAGASALSEGSAPLPYEVFFETLPAAHTQFYRNLKLAHETEDGVFSHAGLDTTIGSLEQQPRSALLMGTFDFVDGYRGPPLVVYGHRNNADVRDGWPHPRVSSWTIGIDTIAHGVLTAARLPDRSVFQSARHRLTF